MDVKRGQVYFADIGDNGVGSEQNGTRPVIIIQNDIGNHYSPTVIVACMTTSILKNQIPTHVQLDGNLVLAEQIKTIDKSRLRNFVNTLSPYDMVRVDKALRLSLGL
ncbi:MAG: type II toxin-antitoxin system PemK/MazF family toxin [Firmicutes bacterium]|nr:type II toxin-antitoxin system PemK/MazF family toxin [Bacillota bacterium]